MQIHSFSGCSQSQLTLGGRWGTPWTGLQFTTGPEETIHPYGQFSVTNQLVKVHMFGLWEDAGVPGENPAMATNSTATECTQYHLTVCISHYFEVFSYARTVQHIATRKVV